MVRLPRTPEELLRFLEGLDQPTVQHTIRVRGGRVSDGQPLFEKVVADAETEDGDMVQVEAYRTAECDNRHLLGDGVTAAGECPACGLVLCTRPGCSFTCARCGGAFCGQHAKTYGDAVLCRAHAPMISPRAVAVAGRAATGAGRALRWLLRGYVEFDP